MELFSTLTGSFWLVVEYACMTALLYICLAVIRNTYAERMNHFLEIVEQRPMNGYALDQMRLTRLYAFVALALCLIAYVAWSWQFAVVTVILHGVFGTLPNEGVDDLSYQIRRIGDRYTVQVRRFGRFAGQ